jgi:hypothetical protein
MRRFQRGHRWAAGEELQRGWRMSGVGEGDLKKEAPGHLPPWPLPPASYSRQPRNLNHTRSGHHKVTGGLLLSGRVQPS